MPAPERRPGRPRAWGVSWNTANDAVLAEGRRVLIEDPDRLDGVRVLGVDEHLWRQTRRGGKYVTVIIDLTGIREGTGPARLLDMVSGRSKQAFKQCLAGRDESWREAWRGRRDGRPSPGSRPPPPRNWPMRSRRGIRFTSCASPVMPQVSAVAGSSRTPAGTGAARATLGMPPGGPCTPAPVCSPTSSASGRRPRSPAMSTFRSRPPGASTSASSPPTATPTRANGASSCTN
ncbi:MAG: transposase [Actinomycetales bacterium]|nr:transposase [Actinomycetales bacterium]